MRAVERPRLGCLMRRTRLSARTCRSTTAAVPSLEPSSTTSNSKSANVCERTESIAPPMKGSTLKAGMMMLTVGRPAVRRVAMVGGGVTCGFLHPEPKRRSCQTNPLAGSHRMKNPSNCCMSPTSTAASRSGSGLQSAKFRGPAYAIGSFLHARGPVLQACRARTPPYLAWTAPGIDCVRESRQRCCTMPAKNQTQSSWSNDGDGVAAQRAR